MAVGVRLAVRSGLPEPVPNPLQGVGPTSPWTFSSNARPTRDMASKLVLLGSKQTLTWALTVHTTASSQAVRLTVAGWRSFSDTSTSKMRPYSRE